MNYLIRAITERSQVQFHGSLTELGVISREGRRQGAVEGNGRRGKKWLKKLVKRESRRTFIFSFEIWGL